MSNWLEGLLIMSGYVLVTAVVSGISYRYKKDSDPSGVWLDGLLWPLYLIGLAAVAAIVVAMLPAIVLGVGLFKVASGLTWEQMKFWKGSK